MLHFDRRKLGVKQAALMSLAAFLVPVAFALLMEQVIMLQVSGTGYALTMLENGNAWRPTRQPEMTDSVHRGRAEQALGHVHKHKHRKRSSMERRKTIIVRKKGCKWPSIIEGTNTTPVALTVGLSIGSAAGMVIFAFACYQYGRVAPSKGGGMGGMGGGGMGGY